MENPSRPFKLPEEAIKKTATVGCLQFFPIFFMLLLAWVGFVMNSFDMADADGNRLPHNYERWIVLIFLFLSLIGLILGILSSLFFFSARNKSNITTMKKGIMLNITAWIFYTVCLLISITFILDL